MTALPHHRYQGLAKGSGNLQAVASSVTRSDMGLSKNLFEDNYHGIPKTGNFWGNTRENMGHDGKMIKYKHFKHPISDNPLEFGIISDL